MTQYLESAHVTPLQYLESAHVTPLQYLESAHVTPTLQYLIVIIPLLCIEDIGHAV